jgi:threonine/homoserine/homoserine lactone efflux protein
MIAHPKFILFLVASAVLILTPGPAVLYIVTRSISQGRTSGIVSVAGVGLGNLTHAVAASLGLSAILASSALAFAALKYVGAAYLLFLGLRKLLTRSALSDTTSFRKEPLSATFKQGVLVGTLNPKTALFFLAFLPQFADPSKGAVWSQLLFFGTLFVIMAVLSDTCYALLAGTFSAWLKQRQSFLRGERYVSGTVYCGLGIATALSNLSKSS